MIDPRPGCLTLTLLFAAHGLGATEPVRVLPLATGAVTGAYFPAGVALCRVANERRRETGLRCSGVPSDGSLANVATLRDGDADLALVQSDVQDAAVRGAGAFAGAAFAELRSVAALFPEPLTLVVGADAGIAGLEDLPGKRVGVGPAGAGQRPIIEALMGELGWQAGVFAEMAELETGLAVAALCERRIDAFFLAVGHPALAVTEATSACGARLAPLAGPAVDAVLAGSPFYFATDIPGGIYPGAAAPTPTLGVGATLVTRADVPAVDVEIVLGAILDNLDALEGFDAILVGLDPQQMPRQGLSAPLHPGAQAAYSARGLAE